MRLLAAAALSALLLVPLGTAPAHAMWCTYSGHNPFTGQWDDSISGTAVGISEKRVCKRAKKRCVRDLRRAWNKGRANGFGCKRAHAG